MSETKVGPSYLEQDGCHNCKHCYHWDDWEEAPAELCALQGPAPPHPNGSNYMDEPFDCSTQETLDRDREAWEVWEEGRSVEPWGKCASWASEKESPLTTV